VKMSRLPTFIAAACIAGFPAIVMGEDSTLVLVLGGEAYDGPPKFEVTFGGKLLGQGAVAAAIDTASVGRFADAADKTPFVQTFTFTVPEAVFRPDAAVGVSLLNEANGGPGSNRDRNLYLASVSVNGKQVSATGLTTTSATGLEPNAMLGDFLMLPDNSKHGVSQAPEGGWPTPASLIAAARLPASMEPVALEEPVEIKVASTDPLIVGSIPRPAAAEVESLEVASLDPDPEGGATGCGLDEVYNVIGFNENSNELTPSLVERLNQVIAERSAAKQRHKRRPTVRKRG